MTHNHSSAWLWSGYGRLILGGPGLILVFCFLVIRGSLYDGSEQFEEALDGFVMVLSGRGMVVKDSVAFLGGSR